MAHQDRESIQAVQSNHRRRLLATWPIGDGASVLEVGCGQGDMTAELASAVGSSGRVVAVDRASPDYGAPETLRQATDRIRTTPVGERIQFRFEFDVLDPEAGFAPDEFDYAVLAHASWYFESEPILKRTLSRLRSWARTLCFAEWDLQPQRLGQVPHMLAVLIQGQTEARKSDSLSNVRTPLTRGRLVEILESVGWRVVSHTCLDAGELQDADWEIRAAYESAQDLQLSDRERVNLEVQLDLLSSMAIRRGNPSLGVYSIVAERG
jgi:SAM-dependent methyltransferase